MQDLSLWQQIESQLIINKGQPPDIGAGLFDYRAAKWSILFFRLPRHECLDDFLAFWSEILDTAVRAIIAQLEVWMR